MDRRDFCSIGRSAQEELRRRAVFLVLHDGLSQAEAARIVGVERQAVNIWVKRYRAEGDDGLLDGRRVSPRRGKGLGLSTVQLYLQRWGLSPQKPLARAKERQPSAIKAWLETDYPAIAKRAKAEKAVIFWGDETGISNQDQIGRSWAPKGETPIVSRIAKRASKSLISAVSNRGLMHFTFYDAEGERAFRLNVDLFIAFMRRLIKDADRRVFLVV